MSCVVYDVRSDSKNTWNGIYDDEDNDDQAQLP